MFDTVIYRTQKLNLIFIEIKILHKKVKTVKYFKE